MKYFLHRIQKENGDYTKGIEVHDALNDAIRSFWGRMKLAYNNSQSPNMTFVSCKITDSNGSVIEPYNKTWLKEPEENNTFFFHHIKIEGDTVSKDIDILNTYDAAMVSFATQMEYGYNNPRFQNISFISCEITDLMSDGMVLTNATWIKESQEGNQETEPEI